MSFSIGDKVVAKENYGSDVNKGDTGRVVSSILDFDRYGGDLVDVHWDKLDYSVSLYGHRLGYQDDLFPLRCAVDATRDLGYDVEVKVTKTVTQTFDL